jgi:hypothetical protein
VRAYFFWSAKFPPALSAVRRYAPQATHVYTGPAGAGDPCAYARKVAGYWGRDDMLFIEHDIVIRKNTVRDLARCPNDWCAFSYGVGRNHYDLRFGLGCTKFSLAVQRQIPYARILTHNARNNGADGTPMLAGDCPVCILRDGAYCEDCGDSGACWASQDVWLRHELMRLGFAEPCVHGSVGHLHDYRGWPDLIDDNDGSYSWDFTGSAFARSGK